jgi:histone H3/H4
MKTVSVNIGNVSIIEEANKLSSFVGKDRYTDDNIPLYDKIKIIKQDSPILDRYINEAVNKLTLILQEYISTIIENSGIITLSMPTSFPDSIAEELQEAASNFVLNYTFGRWMRKKGMKEDAEEYLGLSAENLIDVQEKLYLREKPTIPTHP